MINRGLQRSSGPIKRLGQNFLVNKGAIEKIVSFLDIGENKNEETILEIGPGQGQITREILKYTDNIVAVEKDEKLAEETKILSSGKNFKVVKGDIREKLAPAVKRLKRYKIIGNIPYYLTGYIFRLIQGLKNSPQKIVFVVQKEVAERIAEKGGERSRFSNIVALWARPKIAFNLKKGSFWPAPKVESAVLVLDPLSREERLKDEEKIIEIIKAGFKHPRKTLFNNLSYKYSKEKILDVFKKLNWSEKIRPQDLSRENWIDLSRNILAC